MTTRYKNGTEKGTKESRKEDARHTTYITHF